ncbi:MAG TPA: tripartite tricarboxylate transporter permease [Hyphomicrobiaceae bacterium]|nr:tripartite tricarboxylate transporter permease [Hyphomicrobiaceae bacterium]
MELFGQLVFGFEQALTLQNVFFCFIGALIGTLVGVLPGLGPVATIAMLLPITFTLPPVAALIMLAGLYYGAQYGGSTTAILVNIPGESSSVVTCLDGHAMARRGRAGAALAIAAVGSFFAGSVATFVIAIFSGPMVWIASTFQSPDYFGLMIFGLIAAVVLAQGSVVRSIVMVLVGLTLGLAGTDITTGQSRFTFGLPQLSEGISFVALAMGLFGVGEVISNLARTFGKPDIQPVTSLWPNREEVRRATPAALRGTVIGSLLGVLPGGGALIASFGAYVIEKKWSKRPQEFGNGAVEGVAAPEAANNAGAQTSFIPLLTLGLPSNAVMALMLAAMTIHGIVPGPKLMTERPDLFWAMIASMWIGNLMLVIINLPLIRIWVMLLTIPYRWLYLAILIFCCIGAYSVQNSTFDVLVMALFGVVGYLLPKIGCEPAPLILGVILSPHIEENFRRSLVVSRGSWWVFVERPVCAGFLLLSLLFMLAVLLPSIRKGRDEAFREE